MNQLLEKSDVKLVQLTEPRLVRTVTGQESQVSTTVDIRLGLQTAAGREIIDSPVTCHTLDTPEDETLLGRDTSASLVIDIDRELEQLASKIEEDNDPFASDDTYCDSSAVRARDDVHAPLMSHTIDAMVVRDGSPLDKRERLWVVVLTYDVWRLTLGDDPPARVAPLKLRLKKEARPYRFKCCQYSSVARGFFEHVQFGIGTVGMNL
ncbi:TPA: hypothetical protein N0F65_001071 [Lagenidium giganteum]|uniref:Uncharacterized protein n=1 Tax=Lagenidium giganteum TaxID=4803 RepID=A0AAV2YL38_9STRA|nr:TPA: hypothetical protein N0F65_001071 [Lagenidium giganteum]